MSTIEKMSKNQIIPTQSSVDIFKNTKNIFEKMQKENQLPNFSQDQIEFYKNALRSEENSYKFYTEKALMLEEGEQKQAFLRIAEEEREHMILLQNLLTFAMDPVTWIENHELKMPL